MFERYTTLDHVQNTRLDYWNDLVGRLFDGMTVSASHSINADWVQCRFGNVGLALARSQRARVSRWAESSPVSNSDRILVHLQHGGVSRTEQRRGSAVLCAGEMTVCWPDEPYRIDISDRNEMFVLDCPASVFDRSAATQSGVTVPVLTRQVPAVGLLHDFVGSLFRQSWVDPVDPAEAEALGEVLTTLVRHAVSGMHVPADAPAGNRARILAFVETHLCDSGLRTSVIAERLSMSVRSVQTVFAEMATTPTAFITERRLTVAAELIRGGVARGTITELAHELGFCDAAHLARRFRAHFGSSPSAYAKRYGKLH